MLVNQLLELAWQVIVKFIGFRILDSISDEIHFTMVTIAYIHVQVMHIIACGYMTHMV